MIVDGMSSLTPHTLYTHDRRRKRAKKGGKVGKAKTIARSNQGCHRTRVFCPRCKEEWGLPVQVRRTDRQWCGRATKAGTLSSYSHLPLQLNFVPSFPGSGALHLQLFHDGPEILHLLHLPALLRKHHRHSPVSSNMEMESVPSKPPPSEPRTDWLTNTYPKPQPTYSCPFCRKVNEPGFCWPFVPVQVDVYAHMIRPVVSTHLPITPQHHTTRYVRPSSTTPTTTTATSPAAIRYASYYIYNTWVGQPRSLRYCTYPHVTD